MSNQLSDLSNVVIILDEAPHSRCPAAYSLLSTPQHFSSVATFRRRRTSTAQQFGSTPKEFVTTLKEFGSIPKGFVSAAQRLSRFLILVFYSASASLNLVSVNVVSLLSAAQHFTA